MEQKLTKLIQKPVFFDHNGTVDDFVALITLLTLDQFRLTGVSIINGNCCVDSAVEATLRILDLFCRHDIQLAKSIAEPANPFPDHTRMKSRRVNTLNILANQKANFSKLVNVEVPDFITQKLMAEDQKTTVILTGPPENLINAILNHPEIVEKIEKVIWVAGAFLNDGNVIAPDHDGSAEWNIFWNPAKASELIKTGVPITFLPLDVTQQLPIDNYLIYHLDKHKDKVLSQLVLSVLEPEYDSRTNSYMNSVAAPVFLAYPQLFQVDSKSINIELRGTSMGNIYRTSLGSRIKHVTFVDEEEFYEILIKQLKQF